MKHIERLTQYITNAKRLVMFIPAMIAMVCLAPLPGCAAALDAITAVAKGSTWLAGQIDTAEAHANLYLDRHPNPETEERVKDSIAKARAALAALEASAKAVESASGSDSSQATLDAIAAFTAVKNLLIEFGINTATPPDGGAENDEAPQPKPFELPSDEEIERRLSQ